MARDFVSHALASASAYAQQQHGVIDIGSNSVRLVIREGEDNSAPIIFEKKKRCGLAGAIADTGNMGELAMDKALKTLKKFRQIVDDSELTSLRVVGTAPFRQAENAQSFWNTIKEETGFEVDVISGDQEATYAAKGVLVQYPDASGIVADMGGGSTDIALIENGEVQECISLPIGTRIIKNIAEREGIAAARRKVAEHIEAIPQRFKGAENAYMIGGTWRNISNAFAKGSGIDIEGRSEECKIIAGTFCDYAQGLEALDHDGLIEKGIKKKRLDLIKPASWVADSLCDTLDIEHTVLTDATMRDGVFAETYEELEQDTPFVGKAFFATPSQNGLRGLGR